VPQERGDGGGGCGDDPRRDEQGEVNPVREGGLGVRGDGPAQADGDGDR
jgi:hypothetical protein